MRLEEIGFYSLSDARARTACSTSKMMRCEMLITPRCNFRCTYCKGATWPELSLEEIKRNIDLWCSRVPLQNIRFSGGEPTLHPNIIGAVSYAKAKGIQRIAISTNGYSPFALYQKLVNAGVNDFSISLDADNAEYGDKLSQVPGSWQHVIVHIREMSKWTYVTVGIVLTKENIGQAERIIRFASNLGVADIRIIPAAQENELKLNLKNVPDEILNKHPILKYRVTNTQEGKSIRGIKNNDSHACGLVLDDSVIAGAFHFPCVIYLREGGKEIGKVGPNMRNERLRWYMWHDVFEDPICRENCLDVCIAYNNRFEEFLK